MKYCDFGPLPAPFQLAYEEALLEHFENQASQSGAFGKQLLCFWEPQDYFVVLGYANRAGTEVNLDVCRNRRIPVYRRVSGGGTVLQGPGCLNYAVLLRIDEQGPARSITSTNHYCMERNRQILAALTGKDVRIDGHTDLAINGVKFSGNAQRRRKHYLIFHGCLLLDMDISRIQEALPMPSQQPGYRAGRTHKAFLTNLGVPPADVAQAFIAGWQAESEFDPLPKESARILVETKYAREDWNLKF
jgi:lipoate-protein ligase A